MKEENWISTKLLFGLAIAGLWVGYATLAAGPEEGAWPPATNNAAGKVVDLGTVDLPADGSSAALAPKALSTNAAAPARGSVHLRPDAPQPVPLRLDLVRSESQRGFPKPKHPFDAARERMATDQLAAPGRGISPKVIEAMTLVPRHNFVPAEALTEAYQDKSLEIDPHRTIAAPFTVAAIAEQLNPSGTDRVLELSTGSGYQTAVLSHLAREVYSVESSENLAARAQFLLSRLGYTNNVFLRQGDIIQGWPEAAPFDVIIVNEDVTNHVSDAVLAQLRENGRLIVPSAQDGSLQLMRKAGSRVNLLSTRSTRPAPVEDNKVDLVPVLKVEVAKPQ